MQIDRSAVLPNGNSFFFWEKECMYSRTLYVDSSNPAASDSNDGSETLPFKTINAAAKVATPGTLVRIHAGIYHECV